VREQNEKVDMSTMIKCIELIFYKYLKAEGPKQSSKKYQKAHLKTMTDLQKYKHGTVCQISNY
jgi:hypothetical protein